MHVVVLNNQNVKNEITVQIVVLIDYIVIPLALESYC